ncbi:MAG: M23 family metallopeptidase [Firmicutes bacterium]|nr:M23 family metallopeptidase [Bacillota bacterium]
MAVPVVVVKAAVAVVTNPKLLKIVGGIILGIIIVIIAPIAILLGVMNTGQSIDWNSPEMRQQVVDNMTPEQKAQLQAFADTMQAIEDEITAQGLAVNPIKAQVIFLCVMDTDPMKDRTTDAAFYTDFVSCFPDGADDDTVFANLTAKFGVTFTAEEKAKILQMCQSAVASQTVAPTALHDQIGTMLAGDTTPVSAEPFASPFHGLDWKTCVTSTYGTRKDPFTGETASHAGLDLAAPEGTPIYPSKPGKVLLVGYDEGGYGNYVVINHGGGQATLYGHCSEILVAEGDNVTVDTVIAKVGSTGRSTGNHCHFEIIIDGKPVNPKKYLEATAP